jgi:phosphatidylglycerophosphatase C
VEDREGLAAFDFDGTITRRDTLVPFLVRVAGRRRFAGAWARIGAAGARGGVPLTDRDAVKAELVRLLLAGRDGDELRRLGDLYARDLLSDALRPMVVDRIHRHRARGHRTVIVSASLVYYLEPLARTLGIDAVIGVEPEESGGRLTGRLARPNVRAEEKALRLREWLGIPPDEPPGVTVWAYGNTSGDHALLAMADRAFWLGRPSKVPDGAELLTPETPLD